MHFSIIFLIFELSFIKEANDVIGKDKCLSLFDNSPKSLIKEHIINFSSSLKYLNKDGSNII
jgi:hypothetical protein